MFSHLSVIEFVEKAHLFISVKVLFFDTKVELLISGFMYIQIHPIEVTKQSVGQIFVVCLQYATSMVR